MKSQTILKVGIYLVGVYALLTSATNGAYYLISFMTSFDSDATFFAQAMTPHLFAYFIFPLLFAFWAFGFADRSVRLLIGRAGGEALPGIALGSRSMLLVGLQILGIYLVVHHGASCISFLLEGFLHKARDTNQPDPRVAAETVYSVVGLVAGLLLSFRPQLVEQKIKGIEPDI